MCPFPILQKEARATRRDRVVKEVMHIPTLISRKREGEELSAREIRQLIEGYTAGEVPDYQMSAFAMAVFFKGMTAGGDRRR